MNETRYLDYQIHENPKKKLCFRDAMASWRAKVKDKNVVKDVYNRCAIKVFEQPLQKGTKGAWGKAPPSLGKGTGPYAAWPYEPGGELADRVSRVLRAAAESPPYGLGGFEGKGTLKTSNGDEEGRSSHGEGEEELDDCDYDPC